MPTIGVPAQNLTQGFYTKSLSVLGLPILGSNNVDDRALFATFEVVGNLIVNNAALVGTMTGGAARLVIIGARTTDTLGQANTFAAWEERLTDLPEFAFLRGTTTFDGRPWEPVRGAGGTIGNPAAAFGEENILRFANDPYGGQQSILVHEFAHSLMNIGWQGPLANFTAQWQAAFDNAVAGNLWSGLYARSNTAEYFAELTQIYFNVKQPQGAGIPTTRDGLMTYDPVAYNTLTNLFRNDGWKPGDFFGTDAANTFAGTANADVMLGMGGGDTLNGNDGADHLYGGAGIDVIAGGAAADRLFGEDDNDQLDGGLGYDTIDGGAGIDESSYANETLAVAANLFSGLVVQRSGQPDFAVDTLLLIENLRGGSGADFLIGDNIANRLEGGLGADNLWGYGGNDTLIGGDGSDVLVGGDNDDSLESGIGQDWLYGQGGVDTLRGTDAAANAFNVLVGGDGDDILIAGPTGFDYFYGGDGVTGGGNDSFVIAANSGIKVMNDFEAGGVNDAVRLLGTAITSFGQAQTNLSFSGTINGTVLVVDASTQVWFLGRQPDQLTAADFLFA